MSAPHVDIDDSTITSDSPPDSPGAVHFDPSSQPPSPLNLTVTHAPWGGWSQADYRSETFIRGPTYLTSRHKIAARAPWFECVDLEVLLSRTRQENTAGRAGSPIARLHERHPPPVGLTSLAPNDPSFTLVLNFMVPLKNDDGVYVVMYFQHRPHNIPLMASPPAPRSSAPLNEQKVQVNSAGEYADPALEAAARSAFLHAWSRFVSGSNEYRDAHLKFIPHLIEGPWVVKKAMGTKPAVLGSKLKQSYHANAKLNVLEVDIDVCSSKIAANIFGVVKSTARELIIDLSFVVEGQDTQTLPEVLLAAARIVHIDVKKAVRV